MKSGERRNKAYPWLILVSCCLLQGAGLGIISNCAGVFFVPVMEEFGLPLAAVSLHVTINNVFQCISTLFVIRIISRFKVKYLIPLSGMVVGLSQISLAFSKSIVHWYICAVIQGIFIVYVTGILIPLAVSNWFTKRAGFALGMTSMSAGLVGALMSAILGVIVSRYSWRAAIAVSGIVILIMTVPMQYLVMELEPEKKGCVPFGGFLETPIASQAVSKRLPFDIRVIALVVIAFCSSFSAIFNNQLPAYGLNRGLVLVAPTILLSLNMIGNMTSKISFGTLNDYIGAKRTTILAFIIVAVAAFLLIMGSDIVICFAAFFFGFNSVIATTQPPLLAKEVYHRKEYPMSLQVAQISVRLSYALFAFVEGALFDIWGSFKPNLILQMAVCGVGIIFVFLLFAKRKKTA